MPDRYTTRLLVALALMLGPLRLSLAQETHYFQSWSPSGDTMLFSSTVGQARGLSLRAMDSGAVTSLSLPRTYRCCASWSPDGSVILYNTFDGDLDIVAYDIATETATTIVENGIHDGGPSWSPLGGQFAHTSVRDDNTGAGIFITQSDGSARRPITDLENRRAFNSAWSPDGTRVVYLGTMNANNEVYTINADGTDERRLTFNSATEYQARFTPDGTHIMFLSTRDGDNDLYRMDLDGTGVVNLSDDTGEVENYAFSHDGSAIVYDTDASGSYQVYMMWPDGTHKRRLTYLGVPVKYPYFTHDDRHLVIHYKVDDDTHIALMDLPSLQVTSLTADHFAPLTFPDDLKIAFTSYRGGSADVYFINPDGTGLTQITDTDDDNSYAERLDEGRTLRFFRSRERKNFRKYVRNLATGEERLYIDEPMAEGDTDRVFNRDSSLVAFRKEVADTLEWFVGRPGSGDYTQITRNAENREPALLLNAAWSNSGTKLAYLNGTDYYNLYLKIYDTETQTTRIYTRRGYMNSGMKWAHDDGHIFLSASTRETNYELWALDLESRAMTQLTFDPTSGNVHFDISPDGRYLVFESQRDSVVEESVVEEEAWNSEIYVMRTDGTQPIRLTDHPDFDGRPIWFPVPN